MTRPDAGPAGARFAAGVEAAARRLAEAPAQAEDQARRLLRQAPNDPRLLLILASARRRQGAAGEALGWLQPLAQAYPRAANTQYELGAALADLGETQAALAALRRAVALNRELAEAWRTLGELLFRAGDVRGAEAAFAEQGRAGLADPGLKAAADALAAGRPEAAERLARVRLASAPDDATAHRLQGEALDRLARYGEAEAAVRRALALDDGYDGARFTLATILFHQQKAAEAIDLVRRLRLRDARQPAYRNLYAACLSLLGDMAEVEAVYRALVEEFPAQPQAWLNYAHALRTIGRAGEAVAAYRRCIALAPGLGDAYWGLANLKVERFSDAEAEAMARELARPDLAAADRLHLCYALGKALEDRGDWAGSFGRYAEGSRLRRAEIAYSAERTTADTCRAMALFTPEVFAARSGAGASAADPIFVVGLPRSGSTLVEQILASHPQVEGVMELPDLGLIARGLAAEAPDGGDHLDVLPGLDPDRLRRLGEDYLQTTRAHRKLGRPMFVDKMPNNFQHLGLIQLILPQARVVDVRRHPLGAGFSVFKQHFAQGQAFSYSLEEIGAYYRDYVALMAHFDAVLPGRVVRVIYENLVEDTEGQVRRLLDRLGLPFDPACLRFYETARAVKTVSSEQVRRPIFREGLDRWRGYEPWLGPLKAALGPALDDWRPLSATGSG